MRRAFSRFRQLLRDGAVGRPLAVDFSWLLDTSHGADYFRRWHREKINSGGLLVHKATHHFDLVNWWLDAHPQQVFALGDLLFYGADNAAARGETYDYARYTGVPAAADDPFALSLESKPAFRGLYLDAEAETGYIRDRNVFRRAHHSRRHHDRHSALQQWRAAVLIAWWLTRPGKACAWPVTGTGGRLELDIHENVTHLKAADADASASKGAFKQVMMRCYPMFGEGYEVAAPAGEGGHGGADPLMLADLFAPDGSVDALGRAASHIDGAASILVGIAANMSMETGRLVDLRQLFDLSPSSCR